MGLSHEHVGSKILAKIKIYILTRAELLFTLCYEIPCNTLVRKYGRMLKVKTQHMHQSTHYTPQVPEKVHKQSCFEPQKFPNCPLLYTKVEKKKENSLRILKFGDYEKATKI